MDAKKIRSARARGEAPESIAILYRTQFPIASAGGRLLREIFVSLIAHASLSAEGQRCACLVRLAL